MNNDRKTSRTAAPLDAKPDLVKRIGNTTFDIHSYPFQRNEPGNLYGQGSAAY